MGTIRLTVSATGVSDFFGDVGAGSQSTSWATGTDVPVVVSVGAGNPTLLNTPVQTVDVVLSEPIDPASFDYQALSLTLNGGPNLITLRRDCHADRRDHLQHWRAGSLDRLDGDYDLTVSAAGFVDGSGNAGVGLLSESWTMNTVGPTIVSLPDLHPVAAQHRRPVRRCHSSPSRSTLPHSPTRTSRTPRRAVPTSSRPASRSPNSRRPNSRSPTSITWSFPIDGTYTFTVSAAGVMDLAGNIGTGTASDYLGPFDHAARRADDLAISPDTGSPSPPALPTPAPSPFPER